MVLWQQGMDRVHHSDSPSVAADDDRHTWAWFEIGCLIDHSITVLFGGRTSQNNRRPIINVGGPNNASDKRHAEFC
jgi:hypothetical protein